ncbi:MAG: MmgE/PrpD family protein [Gammaproteobacteria bacterium]
MNAHMKDEQPASAVAPALLDRVAEFSAGIRLQAVPAAVRRQGVLNILDTIGCIASGARLPESQQLLAAERARGGPAEASVLGAGTRLPVEAATRVNAYMGDVFELNDLIGGHASIATVTPALALAQALGAPGARLVEAVIAGVEVVCRVHGGFYAHQKPFTETAMVQVTVASAIGAAAAAAKMHGFDVERTRQALAIAGALASWGPAEMVFGEGNSMKPILFGGWPGAVGLMAANYAGAGLTGAMRLLESPIGYYATVARGYDEKIVLDFDHWRLAEPRRKLHACCGYTHSAIDAVAGLRRAGTLAGGGKVRVHLPAYIFPAVVKNGRAPTTPNEARFNIEYCLAHAAVDADVILPDHSIACEAHLKRPEITAAMGRFEAVVDPAYGHYRHSRVEVMDASGAVIERLANDAPRGSEWNPMTDDEVRAKFRRLAEPIMDGARIDAWLARVDALERAPDCGWLLESFD